MLSAKYQESLKNGGISIDHTSGRSVLTNGERPYKFGWRSLWQESRTVRYLAIEQHLCNARQPEVDFLHT